MANLKIRKLTKDEADKLPLEAFPGCDDRPDPDTVTVVGLVDEDSGQVVASMMFFGVVHCEGIWLTPSLRGDSDNMRTAIFQLLLPYLRESGVEGFVSQILPGQTGRMEGWVKALGARPVPGATYYFSCRGDDHAGSR